MRIRLPHKRNGVKYIMDFVKNVQYFQCLLAISKKSQKNIRAVWNKSSIVLGKFGYDKIKIAKTFIKNLKDDKRHCLDIKVGSPYILNGNEWTDFLASCRFVLGVESGGSVLDHDGSIGKAVNAAINADGDISVEELYKRYVEKEDGSYNLRAISPRHFEAIEEGTCQILYEGDYNGILEPNVHFIELKKDTHMNILYMDFMTRYVREKKKDLIHSILGISSTAG